MAHPLNASQTRVHASLSGFVPTGPWSPLVGPFDPDLRLLRMPLESSDGRLRTWRKTVKDLAAAVYNDVQNVHQDCWLVKAQSGEDFRVYKLSPSGIGNKWTFGRLAYVLKNPHDVNMRTHSPATTSPVVHTLSHRCSLSYPKEYSCINPYHGHGEIASVNESRKYCVNGCLALCDHIPACIFTDKESGRFLPCRNDSAKLVNCALVHDGQCWGLRARTAVHGGAVEYRPSSSPSVIPSSQTTTAGFGPAALRAEEQDTRQDAVQRGEYNLGRRRP